MYDPYRAHTSIRCGVRYCNGSALVIARLPYRPVWTKSKVLRDHQFEILLFKDYFKNHHRCYRKQLIWIISPDEIRFCL